MGRFEELSALLYDTFILLILLQSTQIVLDEKLYMEQG